MSAPFILRPIATTLMIVAIVLLGLLGYRLLPVAPLPSVDFPSIQVVTQFPGASPEVVATSVTAPLERWFGGISGLELMTSTSSYGVSQITLRFSLDRAIDSAAGDVQEAIDGASGWIPVGLLPSPPTYHLVNPADAPILILALTSDSLPLHEVNDYAETILVQKLSQVAGVGAITIEGGQTRAVRVQLNPARLAGLGLSLEDVRRSISTSTANIPKGALDGPRQAFMIDTNDQLLDGAAFNESVVAFRNGAPVLLRDVGAAVDGVEDAEQAAWYMGRPAVILDIQRQPDANSIQVVDALTELLPKLQAAVPPSLKIAVVTDRTTTIRAAIADVQFTLVLTVALVVLVIFLFLRKLWATVIPSVTLPVSLVATFGGMALLGFSLNNLSLMALTIAAGFVVDDAIVMIENIVRYVEAGERPLEAALKGARQIAFTVVSLTISLIAVFIPLLLMNGIVGRLFREFAVTLSLAVLISGAVSLTLTPMMCGRLLRPERPDAGQGRLFRWSERWFDGLRDLYVVGLDWVLRHRLATLAFTAGTLVATGLLFGVVAKGFLPQQDTGLLVAVTDAPQDISFAAMTARQSEVAAIIQKDPDVIALDSFVGVGTVNPALNSGRLYIDIGPPDRRRSSATAVIERLRHALERVEGMEVHFQAVQDIQTETRTTRGQYQYVLQDLDPAELEAWGGRLAAALAGRPELADVTSDRQGDGLGISIQIDRKAAARYGVSIDAIDQTLYDAFGQRQIATLYGPLTQYHAIIEVDPAFRADPGILDKIFLTPDSPGTATGAAAGTAASAARRSGPVPLSAVARLERRPVALTLVHQARFPSVTLSFNLARGVSLGQAVAALHQTERAIGLPAGVTTSLSGATAEFTNSLSDEKFLLVAAVVTVYLVLGILYESFIHPITILSTLPSAGVGALAALMICGEALDLISVIGIILLIGIVKKNAIMMVDFALAAERQEGMAPFEAIRQACILRFRPIMMTTMAALLSALPLALGTGTGSELRRPLGIAIVGGLLVSQILTLYTTPVIYLAFTWLQGLWRRAPGPAAVSGEPG